MDNSTSRPLFYKQAKTANLKYSQQQAKTLQEQLSSIKMRKALVNPFTTSFIPDYQEKQLPAIVLLIGRQMQELPINYLNFAYLQNFISKNFKQLSVLLRINNFLCEVFCRALNRYLQMLLQSQQKNKALNTIKQSQILEFLAYLPVQQGSLEAVLKAEIKIKYSEQLLLCILLYSSSIFISQQPFKWLKKPSHLQNALKISILLIQQAQNTNKSDMLRQFISFTSYLLVLNYQEALRPTLLYQYYLGLNEEFTHFQLKDFEVRVLQINQNLKRQFFNSLALYLQKDAQYVSFVIKMMKRMMSHQINSEILRNHLQALIKVIRTQAFPDLKKRVYQILIEINNPKMAQFVDTVFEDLLRFDPTLRTVQTQSLNRQLAEKGSKNRKLKFLEKYQKFESKLDTKLTFQTINFIIKTYFQQKLNLFEFGIFLEKEQSNFQEQSFVFMHQILLKHKSQYTYQMFEMFVEKRIDYWIKNTGKQNEGLLLFQQKWLQAARNTEEVYQIYLRNILSTVSSNTLNITQNKQNSGFCSLKLQPSVLAKFTPSYKRILKHAVQQYIVSQKVFTYMLYAQVVFGHQLDVSQYSYFSIFFQQVEGTQKISQIMGMIEHLIKLFINPPSVLLYLQSILTFQEYEPEFCQKRMYDLTFLSNFITQASFFSISTYCIQSITILIELSARIEDQLFQSQSLSILKAWSLVMSPIQCNNLCYLFCYRQIKSFFPFMEQKKLKKNEDRILKLWKLIIQLMDNEHEEQEFLKFHQNRLQIVTSYNRQEKVDLQISGSVWRNKNLEMKWDVFIIYTSLKVYKIYLKNHQCFVYSNHRQDSYKEVLEELDLSQQINSAQPFNISLKIQQLAENKYQLNFNICEEIIEMKIVGNLEKIQSRCSSCLFIQNMRIKTNLYEIKNSKVHSQHFGNCQLKIKSISYMTVRKFLKKVNFQLLFGLLAQMLKHFRQFDPSEAFVLLIRVSCRLFTFLLASNSQNIIHPEIALMKTIFRFVLQGFSRTNYPLSIKFRLQLDESKDFFFYLYHLFISALLPHHLWKFFTPQTKQHIVDTLNRCLENEQFKLLENQGIQLFQILGNLVPFHKQKLDFLHRIILTHDLNSFLSIKFEHYLAKIGQIQGLKEKVFNFINGLIECIDSDLKELATKKKLIKFLLFSSDLLEFFLPYSTKQSKIKLILYIFNNSITLNFQNTKEKLIQSILETMQNQQKAQLMILLVIQLQQEALPRKKLLKLKSTNEMIIFQKLTSKQHTTALNLKLYLTIKIWRCIDPETLSDVIVTLSLFLQRRANSAKENQSIYQQTQNTICTAQYLQFLFTIKTSNHQSQASYQEQYNKVFEYSLQIIMQSPKQKVAKFMHHYLQYALKNLEFALLPFTKQRAKSYKVYTHFVVLQYIYQIFIKMKYAGYCFDSQKGPTNFSSAVVSYIQFLVVNIQGTKEIKKSLLYVYPEITINKNLTLQKSLELIKTAQSQECRQIKGGIYYKLMLILLELLQNCIEVDFTKLIQLTLLVKEVEKKPKFSFLKSKQKLEKQSVIQRQSLVKQLQLVKDQHLRYYRQVQVGIIFGKQKEKEISLCMYLIDFFVMRLCEYLKSYCEDLDQKVLLSYSSIVLRFFKNYKIQQTSSSAFTQILKYQDLLYLSNPQTSNAIPRQEHPPNNPVRRQHYIDEIIAKLIDLEQRFDPRLLCRLFRDINISLCFGTREKEIRLMQFLDIHHILNRTFSLDNPVYVLSQRTKLQYLLEENYKSLKKYKMKADSKQLEFALRKIKKIYPYTSPNRTVMRIMDHCFDNMASPITQFIACKDYSLKKLRHLESSNMVYFEQRNEDQHNSVAQKRLLKQLLTKIQTEQENMKDSLSQIKKGNQYCELVTREGVYFCQWHLSLKNLKLQPLKERPSSQEIDYMIKGAHKLNLITKSLTTFYICFQDIEEIFYRKFCQVCNSIQIFLKNGTSKFINLYKRKHLFAFIKILENMVKGIKIIKQPTKQFANKNFTQKWIEGHLSNFDYLMLLNKYSGRTQNDLNQYYVFPWILSDYKQNKLDLTNPNAYRDLSKPIGAQNPQKLQRFKFFYKNNNRSHYYGSHYSTSLFILYYLVRLQPFSTLHRDMQKGNFDLPDRLFSSIEEVWSSLMSPCFISDVKQLIPEFYYLPVFLKNVGNIQFGQKMCGQEVSDVILPRWAQNPEEFTLTLRAALQSDWVSKNLHLWIDLIFGVHQHSQKKYNIFLASSYQQKAQQMWKKGPVDEGVIHQIMFFGQCPSKLFTIQHKPKRFLPELKLERSVHRSNTQCTYPSTSFVQIKPDLKIVKLSKNKQKIIIQFEKPNKGIYLQAEVEPDSTLEQLRISLKSLAAKDKSKTEDADGHKKRIDFFRTELRIGKEPILALQMNYVFQHTAICQMWIACYGLLGVRVYNWQQQLYWKWQKEEVCKAYIQATRMIFATPSGKVCFYSFFSRQLDEIQVINQCSTMLMEVHRLPRLPNIRENKNEIDYRLLCAFDNKKLMFVSYTFREIFNHTSLKASDL